MLKSVFAVLAASMLVAACDSPPPQAAAPPPAPPPAPVAFTVTFDTDRSNLSPQAQATVQQAVAAYRARAGATVSAVGHTDTLGANDYNVALSQRRADTVKNALISGGVPAAAISTSGTGEAGLPVQTGDNVSERRNRSVEIVVGGQVASIGDDGAYCAALSAKYRQYSRAAQISTEVANAMAACANGNYAAGIPVLERTLTNDKIDLPPRR